MADKTVKQWITIRGRHIPIFEGESKEDAIKRLKEGTKKGTELQKQKHIENVSKKKEELNKARDKQKRKSQAMENEATPRRKEAYRKAAEATIEKKQAFEDAMSGKVKAKFKGFEDMQFKGNKNTGKSLSFERREGLGLNPSEYKLSNGDGISPKSLNPNEGNPTNIKKLKDIPGRTSRSTDEIIVKSNYGDKEYIVTREHYKDTKTGYHRAEVVDIRQQVGNKEESAAKTGSENVGLEPSKELGQALYSGSKTGISQELNKLEEGTKVRFRVNGNTRTYTRKGKGFVNEYGQPETRTHVADLLSRSWKHGSDSTLASFYENNLKITSPVKKEESAVKAKPTESQAASKPATAKPAVTEESIQKELSRTAARLASKGYNTPESIEKHIRELSSIRKNDLAKKMGIGGRGEEKIKAMVAKIHEQQQGGKKAEPAKTWQDKDEAIKQKQIANAEKQKAERNVEAEQSQKAFRIENNRKALKQYQEWEVQKKQELEDYLDSPEYRQGHYSWNDKETQNKVETKKKELEDAIQHNRTEAFKMARKLQEDGALPRYSQPRDDGELGYGTILDSTVTADPRYETLSNSLRYQKYQAKDMLRNIMYAEENGRNSFSTMIYDFMGGNKRSYASTSTAYEQKPGKEGYTNFGEFLRDYKKAMKEVGWKVTTSENRDDHRRGYRTVRGGYQSASHSSARYLTFEKIEPKGKKK